MFFIYLKLSFMEKSFETNLRLAAAASGPEGSRRGNWPVYVGRRKAKSQ